MNRLGALVGAAAGLSLMAWPSFAQEDETGDKSEPQFDSKGRQIKKPAKPPAPEKIILPKPLNYVAPIYSEEAKAKNIQGDIILKLSISKDGKVLDAKVVKGLGHGLDQAAIVAVKQIRFSPAKRADGTPFRAGIQYRFELKLKDKVKKPTKPTAGLLLGTVRIQGIDEPLAGARLTLKAPDGTSQQVSTGADGAFKLPPLSPGTYVITIEADGYDTLVVREPIAAGKESKALYRLNPETKGGVIDVYADSKKPPREVTKRTLERREIERIPGTNGDALRSIQSLPGVARPPGILGALIIRGSSPFDTQTFIDGTFVPLIYHFGGLSSVVPTELLSKIDFYPGNFSAKYGRALGGIVDAGLRSPRSDGFHGLVQADLIDARSMVEGPIPGTDKKWTFAAAGRRSYFDLWLGPVLEEAGAGVTQAPVYYDYQFMVEAKPDSSQRFRIAFIGSDDSLQILIKEPAPNEPAISGDVGFHTAFQRLQFHYDNNFGGGKHSFESNLSLGRDVIKFGLAQFFFELEAFEILGRAEYSYKVAKNAKMNLGLDLFSGWWSVDLRLPPPPQPGQPPNQPFSTRTVAVDSDSGYTIGPAVYVEFELTPSKRLRIVPGLRFDYFSLTDRPDVSPRINARYTLIEEFPKTVLKGGIGVFHQPPQFQQAKPPLGTEGLTSNRSIHYGLGVEQELTKQIDVSVEGFFKQNDNLVIGAPSESAFVEYSNDASGYAVGGELLLKYKPDDRFFGWVAYTLSRAVRQNGPSQPQTLAPWDQTHILTILGSARLGHGWEFGARFRLVSGNLITPNVCDPTVAACDPNRIGGLYHGATGAYTPIPFGTITSERLPMFHQLDLRIDKFWQFESWKLSMYLDVQNAYNSQNAEAVVYNFNFSQRQYVVGVPILPSLGLRGEW